MAIVQISKIQQRSGNLVDLPQLDEAEFGWASDNKQLFIGKTTPIENVEVLTAYSNISFSQLDGAVGNLNISNSTIGTGQVLAYDGNNWINAGGTAGGVVDLGAVGNVTITGGSTGYVLETDGLGNLSWSSKGTETAFIESISQANPGLVTTSSDNSLVSGAEVTITNCPGMTEVNGASYYANVQTSNTFTLYSDLALTTTVDTSAFTEFSNTSVSATTLATNVITVGDADIFALNIPVRFVGTVTGTNLDNANTFYVKTASGTSVTVSNELLANGVAGNVFSLLTTTGLTASMYGTGGRLVSPLGGASSGASAGSSSDTQVLYNDTNLIQGDADFTYDATGAAGSGLLTVTGNANVGNLNGTGSVTSSRLISNVATGTTPIVVSSTTRVSNLNVSNSAVAGTVYTAAQPNITSVGTLTSLAVTGNVATGNVSGAAGTFSVVTGSLTTAAQPNVTSLGNLTLLRVSGDITPTANIAYDIGNNTNRFRDLYLSGSTIELGSQSITSNATHTAFTNSISATTFLGNVSGNVSGVLSGDAGNISNVQGANVSGAVAFATTANAVAGANVSGTVALASVAGTVSGAAQANITSLGTLVSLDVTAWANAGNMNATGGIFGYVHGDGANLTFLSGANVSGEVDFAQVANAVAGANVSGTVALATTAGTVTTAAQPNITSTGTLTSLTVSGALDVLSGTLTADTLTTGASGTAGEITGNWSLSSGSRLSATYADLAENYEGDAEYSPGQVVDFGGEKEVTLSTTKCSQRVAGVVSTEPAFMMNEDCPGHKVAVALQGRVPTQVTGHCEKGDLMVSDGNGHATAWHNVATIMQPGVVIGKAIQAHTGPDLGIVEIAVGRL